MLVFLFVVAVLILGLIVFIATLPGKIAKARAQPQAEAIAVCGCVGLPTGILWAVALVWAFLRPTSASELVASNSGISSDSIAELVNQIHSLERSITTLEAEHRKEMPS